MLHGTWLDGFKPPVQLTIQGHLLGTQLGGQLWLHSVLSLLLPHTLELQLVELAAGTVKVQASLLQGAHLGAAPPQGRQVSKALLQCSVLGSCAVPTRCYLQYCVRRLSSAAARTAEAAAQLGRGAPHSVLKDVLLTAQQVFHFTVRCLLLAYCYRNPESEALSLESAR